MPNFLADKMNEGKLVNDRVDLSEGLSEEEHSEEEQAEEEQPEEGAAELPEEELPDEELLVAEIPRANVSGADNARNFTQRHISIRWGIADNPDRGSPNLPEPKHLTIKLPDALAKLFPGVWVAHKGEDILIDFFARNDQDGRSGRKIGDPWRWIKIKSSGEIAMGISRPYTKSRCDGVLVRDYKVGAFKLAVPLVPDAGVGERVVAGQPASRPVFS